MADKVFKVAGIGEVLWDAFPTGEKFGGAPANFSCHCHSLGAEAYVVSCIGRDERGVKAREFLDAHGVDTSCLIDSDEYETGVVVVELDEAGKPEYEIKEGVAWDNIPWTDQMAALAPRLDAVCFGALSQRSQVSRETIRRFVSATEPDCLRVFDINIRQHFFNDEIIISALETANVLKLNDEELPLVADLIGADGSDEKKMRSILKRFDLKLAVLTCGPRGALMITPENSSYVVPPDEPVVNTVGAGDSFTAAVIIGFLQGRSIEDINQHANLVATYVCTQQGAVPKLPDSLLE